MEKKLSKDKIWDYLILAARFLLAITFLLYGFSKLTGGQFGISAAEMTTPVKDVPLFKLAWYLFDHQPFKSFIGISQIICALLLIFNRTALIGAFLFLPIISTILIIDLTIMPPPLAEGFAWRLSYYILLDLLILWHYKSRMKIIWDAVFTGVSTKYNFPVRAYFLLPVFAVALGIIGMVPRFIIRFISSPSQTIEGLMKIRNAIGEVINQLVG